MGKSKTDEKQKAYDLFCNTTLTQKEIASVVRISEQSIIKWVKDGNWELYRTASKVTREKIIYGYYLQLAALNEQIAQNGNIPTPAQSDQTSKLTDNIDKLNKRYNFSSYHSVLYEFVEYYMQVNLEEAKKFGPVMLDFLKIKAKQIRNDKTGR